MAPDERKSKGIRILFAVLIFSLCFICILVSCFSNQPVPFFPGYIKYTCPNNPRLKRNWFPTISEKDWTSLCYQPFYGKNIMKTKPIQFHPDFKNPCWYEENELRCLPYMFLLGVKKSGSTDLFDRITSHPDFVFPGWKESQWLSFARFLNEKKADLTFYINKFKSASSRILEASITKNGSAFHQKITGDAAVGHFHIHNYWPLWPGNNGPEPTILNYHLMRHLVPNAKIILILRDPVERFYSDYFHVMNRRKRMGKTKQRASKQHFHEISKEYVQLFLNCTNTHTLRNCAYRAVCTKGQFRLELNLYSVFINDILKVFPRDQVLFISNEEYSQNMETVMTRVFKFLELRDPTKKKMKRIIKRKRQNVRTAKMKEGPMLNQTKVLLYRLFKPYNEELARIVKDRTFEFTHPELKL